MHHIMGRRGGGVVWSILGIVLTFGGPSTPLGLPLYIYIYVHYTLLINLQILTAKMCDTSTSHFELHFTGPCSFLGACKKLNWLFKMGHLWPTLNTPNDNFLWCKIGNFNYMSIKGLYSSDISFTWDFHQQFKKWDAKVQSIWSVSLDCVGFVQHIRQLMLIASNHVS